FLKAVSPRIAITSVGADNTYGHPSPQTQRVLHGLGTLVVRTDTSGDTAVVLHDDEPALVRRGPSMRRRLSRPVRLARPPPQVGLWPWGRLDRRERRGSSSRHRRSAGRPRSRGRACRSRRAPPPPPRPRPRPRRRGSSPVRPSAGAPHAPPLLSR